MMKISEIWLKLVRNISIIAFSFIFFWGAIFYYAHFKTIINHYLSHLSDQTGNNGYIAIESLVDNISIIVYLILALMPFAITSSLIHNGKISNEKQHILQFFLRLLLFWKQ